MVVLAYRIRKALIRWLAGSMPVALNLRIINGGEIDLGPSASLSGNNRWPQDVGE